MHGLLQAEGEVARLMSRVEIILELIAIKKNVKDLDIYCQLTELINRLDKEESYETVRDSARD